MFKKLIIVLLFGSALSASAQIPDAVLKPYKTYRQALATGDTEGAYNAAEKAWQQSEKTLGDHKITGDLAANFAGLKSPDFSNAGFIRRMRAHARSIDLARLHDTDALELELERHLERVKTGLSEIRFKGRKVIRGGDAEYIEAAAAAIETYAMQDSVFAADLEVLRLQYALLKDKTSDAISAGRRAAELYAAVESDIPSDFRLWLPTYRARAYEKDRALIDAALQYQLVVNDAAPYAGHKAKYDMVTAAWLRLRYALEDAGRLDEAVARGLCEDCGPIGAAMSDTSGKPVPIMRGPVTMPPRAEGSGEVIVLYDLDGFGKVTNIRIAASTDKIFHDTVKRGMKSWRYSRPVAAQDMSVRKDRVVRHVFEIHNGKGKRRGGKSLKTYMDIPGGIDAISDENTIKIIGSRTKIRLINPPETGTRIKH